MRSEDSYDVRDKHVRRRRFKSGGLKVGYRDIVQSELDAIPELITARWEEICLLKKEEHATLYIAIVFQTTVL